ncbi:MAG: hypothetical protein ACRCS9_16610 [Hyphomicrobium sp.]
MTASPDAAATPATPTDAATPARAQGGEIRLSFRFFYVVLKWGQERRSDERLRSERAKYPVLTATHLPVLAAAWAIIFLTAYQILVLALKGLVYAFS